MSAPDPELARLRGSIDNLDSALVCLLAERFKITQRVGELKAELGLPPADPQREAQQIERCGRVVVRAAGLGGNKQVYLHIGAILSNGAGYEVNRVGCGKHTHLGLGGNSA